MTIVSEAMQDNRSIEYSYKEAISYFKEQLKLNAKELKEARDLDKKLHFKHTKEVKELLEVIKLHRSLNNQALVELNKRTNKAVDIQQFYLLQVDKSVANQKQELLKSLKSKVLKE